MNETYDRIVKIIEEVSDIPADEIKRDSSLIEDLDLSSIEVLAIVGKIEKEFSVKLKEDQIMSINSIDDIIKMLDA